MGASIFCGPMKKTRALSCSPAQFPFFYGYVIVLVGTLGLLASLPGQTVGVSTFTDPVMTALNLSRDQFSVAYMIGTLLSACFITRTGIFYDRHGVVLTGGLATALLGTTLLLCSFSDRIVRLLMEMFGCTHWLLSFCVITILFFLLRFSGQGVLTMVSRNMIMKWFDRYKGRVNGLSSVCMALGFSAAPPAIDMLIQHYGWAGAWRVMAAAMVAVFLMVICFYKDNPQQYGLLADGHLNPTRQEHECRQRDYTLVEAVRTWAFWIYGAMLSFNAFFVTGFTFHVVSVFESAGYARSEAIGIFLPIAIVSILSSLMGNYLSDLIRLKYLLYAMIISGMLATLGLIALGSGWGIFLLIGGIGVMGGLFTALMTITWPTFFGLRHLGAISGKAMSMLVLASAIGPVLFSASKSVFHSYGAVCWASMAFLMGIALAADKANPPDESSVI